MAFNEEKINIAGISMEEWNVHVYVFSVELMDSRDFCEKRSKAIKIHKLIGSLMFCLCQRNFCAFYN